MAALFGLANAINNNLTPQSVTSISPNSKYALVQESGESFPVYFKFYNNSPEKINYTLSSKINIFRGQFGFILSGKEKGTKLFELTPAGEYGFSLELGLGTTLDITSGLNTSIRDYTITFRRGNNGIIIPENIRYTVRSGTNTFFDQNFILTPRVTYDIAQNRVEIYFQIDHIMLNCSTNPRCVDCRFYFSP